MFPCSLLLELRFKCVLLTWKLFCSAVSRRLPVTKLKSGPPPPVTPPELPSHCQETCPIIDCKIAFLDQGRNFQTHQIFSFLYLFKVLNIFDSKIIHFLVGYLEKSIKLTKKLPVIDVLNQSSSGCGPWTDILEQ